MIFAKCTACGRNGAKTWYNGKLFCDECVAGFGTCRMCEHSQRCEFKTNPAQIPHALLIGMLLGWLCYRTGSIIPGIIVHWVNNSVAFLLFYFYPRSYDMSISEFFGDSTLRLSGAVVLSLLLFIPALWQLHKTMEKS